MKFAQAMIGLETKDYVAVAVAAEKAGFDSVFLLILNSFLLFRHSK